MYKKILSAVNEHFNSEVTARYALNLARTCKAKLYLCYIAERNTSQISINKAEDAIKRLFNEAMNADIKVEAIIETGNIVDEIKKIVTQEGINIVFAATRRDDIERRFYTGTVAKNIFLKLPCSVAIARIVYVGKGHPKNILVPLKAKVDHLKERVYFTAKILEAFHSKVFVFHVTRPITKFFHGEMHLTPAQWEKRLPEDVKEFIDHFMKYKIAHESKLIPGSTSKSITIEAAAKRHDLIIMGASERGLLSSIIKGNPVEDVLRETPCDLIILKPRNED